jgi:hypothetical protein
LSVLLRFTESDYPFVIFKTLWCLFFFDLRILITPLISWRHCDVCSFSIYGFWSPSCIFKTLWCLFFFDIRILITHLVSSRHYIVCSSLMYGFWLPLCIFKTLCCLFFFEIRILIAPLYLQVIWLSSLFWNTDSDYPFGIFKTLYCLFFFDIRILIIPLVSSRHYVVCSSSTYGFWLTIRYLQHTVLSVLLRYTYSGYPFGIFKTLCYLFFFDIRILITPLVSSRNCVACSSIYGFWFYTSGIFKLLL